MSGAEAMSAHKPLRLGSSFLTRRKSGSSHSPKSSGSAPTEPLPPVPTVPDHYVAQRSPRAQVEVKEALAPKFNMLQPTHDASGPPIKSPAQDEAWSRTSYFEQEFPEMDSDERSQSVRRRRLDERRRLEMEMCQRPLHQSAYGRALVGLLMQQWVVAPSGLAACVPYNMEGTHLGTDAALEFARLINLLVCGAEAFAEPCAGVLGVKNLTQLNRLFVKNGVSPIVPGAMPPSWPPLSARQPPSFLLSNFVPPDATPPKGPA